MNILICKIQYPNDPTNNITAHQHFVGVYNKEFLELYSIFSIQGKQKRVYDQNGLPNSSYYLIVNQERMLCSLRVPSFIDCTKSYVVTLTDDMDIQKLNHRSIPQDIVDKIQNKINVMKSKGQHTQYFIEKDDFLSNNINCKK